jgi:glycosyltransferase involved in cell wall biosynthesis
MVSTHPVPTLPKVVPIYPPKWLIRILGPTPARLLIFVWAAIRRQPHIVGGFHLMYNGIVAAFAAPLAGARSMYICVGGTEVANDGMGKEENCFTNGRSIDITARRRLKIVGHFDSIITMGTRAGTFFKNQGIVSDFHVVPGGIDGHRFRLLEKPRTTDVVVTARLTLVKRIDIFLKAIRLVADRLPAVRVVIIGDGESRAELERLVGELGIDRNVDFVGSRNDVENWLGDSKVFVLTSDLEGLPLSVMEAMMCGVPVVVSDVGDLRDVVEDGVNGYLVPRRSPEILADRILRLLDDKERRQEFSIAAHERASQFEIQATARRWDGIIAGLRSA